MLVLPQALGWVAKAVMDLALSYPLILLIYILPKTTRKKLRCGWTVCPHLTPAHCPVSLPPFPLFQDFSVGSHRAHFCPFVPSSRHWNECASVPRRKSESWNSPSRVLLSNFLSRVRLYHVLNLQLVSVGIAAWALLASGVLLQMSCHIQNEDPGPLFCSRGCQRQRRTKGCPWQSSVEASGNWKHGDVGPAQRQGHWSSPGQPLDRVWRSKV